MTRKASIITIVLIAVIFVFIAVFGLTNQENIKAAQSKITEAQTVLDSAEAELNQAKAGTDDAAITKAQATYDSAKEALDTAYRRVNADIYGVWTLLPPVIAILLAFLTKEVIPSLFIGVATGTFMLQMATPGIGVLLAFFKSFLDICDRMISQLGDPWSAGIILQILCIGGIIALITKTGGARKLATKLAQKAKSPRSSLLVTWLMGLIIFFDDYANSLIVGPVMRPITDSQRISRERLSFIVDATAAPVAGIALISTWISTEMSAIQQGFANIGQPDVNAYDIFLNSIPYRFYNILMLLFVLATIVFLKDFGPMHKAEHRAWTTGEVIRPGSTPMLSEDFDDGGDFVDDPEKPKASMWDALIPLLVLIIGSFLGFWYNGYVALGYTGTFAECFSNADAAVVLVQSSMLASIVAIIMGMCKKQFSLKDGCKTWVSGWKSLIITAIILILAWSLNSTIKSLGVNLFLVDTLTDVIPGWLLPTIIFALGCLISFSTGTSYGTMLILTPMTVPVANAINPGDPTFMIACVGAVLTGAIFGDHCSPISDTTILSSTGSAVDHLDHVSTQLPYALVVGAITIVAGYLLVGLGVNVYISLIIGTAVTFATVWIFGKKPDQD